MRRHLGCPYANKNVFSNRRNSPSSVSGRRSSGGRLFQIWGREAEKLRSPKRVRVLGAMHVSTSAKRRRRRNLPAEVKQDAVVSKVERRHAVQRTTYKLAMLAYSGHDAEPSANGGEVPHNRNDVIPSPCTRAQAGSSVLCGIGTAYEAKPSIHHVITAILQPTLGLAVITH